jgi:hypothetical protein
MIVGVLTALGVTTIPSSVCVPPRSAHVRRRGGALLVAAACSRIRRAVAIQPASVLANDLAKFPFDPICRSERRR